MTNYSFGDILLLRFPHSEGYKTSKRPVLVLADIDTKDVVVAKITSSRRRGIFDIAVDNWEEIGLLFPSVVRIDKLAALSKSRVEKRFGALDVSYHSRIKARLKKLFAID